MFILIHKTFLSNLSFLNQKFTVSNSDLPVLDWGFTKLLVKQYEDKEIISLQTSHIHLAKRYCTDLRNINT